VSNLKSVMQHQFSQVPRADIPRSSFNRSHGYKTTFDSGYLVPFYVDEALPGDTFNLRHNIFARLATPVVPFMDNCFCDTFYFAVPIRLIWDNFKRFNGEQKNPGDSTDFRRVLIASPLLPFGPAVGCLGICAKPGAVYTCRPCGFVPGTATRFRLLPGTPAAPMQSDGSTFRL